MPGSAAGLVRVDAVLGTHIYANAFKASPLVFGAFPSLHGAFASCCFLFVARYSRRGAYTMGFYLLWQWFSTMYLRHHWRLDLLGGLVYSSLAFSLFYPSLGKLDRAYAHGSSGGNGWQRLFEGTSLRDAFGKAPDREAYRGEDWVGMKRRGSSEGLISEQVEEEDLEALWTEGEGRE